MPYDDKLKPKATRYWQLGAIYENEGTIAGTYRVHDNIFLQQFGLSSQKSATSAAATAPNSTTPPSPAAPLATAVSDTQHRTHFQAHVEDESGFCMNLSSSAARTISGRSFRSIIWIRVIRSSSDITVCLDGFICLLMALF